MYKAFLSLRYLRTRYIAMASIVSVMLGVATMIVVNSVMKGFTAEMRSRIQGLLSDIVIETNSLNGAENARKMFAEIRNVAGDKDQRHDGHGRSLGPDHVSVCRPVHNAAHHAHRYRAGRERQPSARSNNTSRAIIR